MSARQHNKGQQGLTCHSAESTHVYIVQYVHIHVCMQIGTVNDVREYG